MPEQHNLVFVSDTDIDALFSCARCGASIGFNKLGIGEPFAIFEAGAWVPPTNFGFWMGPCEPQ